MPDLQWFPCDQTHCNCQIRSTKPISVIASRRELPCPLSGPVEELFRSFDLVFSALCIKRTKNLTKQTAQMGAH